LTAPTEVRDGSLGGFMPDLKSFGVVARRVILPAHR
jgi:hypothetical protein